MMRKGTSAALLAIGVLLSIGNAEAADAAATWKSACMKCHEADAVTYVQRDLKLVDGQLVVPATGMSVATYLGSGHGRLPSSAVAGMVTYLTSLAKTK